MTCNVPRFSQRKCRGVMESFWAISILPMLLTSQVVQTFVNKLDYAWMVVEQTFTGQVTEGQVSEVEYIFQHSTAVELKLREWANPKHPGFQALPLQFVAQHGFL